MIKRFDAFKKSSETVVINPEMEIVLQQERDVRAQKADEEQRAYMQALKLEVEYTEIFASF